MTGAWTAAGNHAVQFYENEQLIHQTIAEFFTRDVHPGDPLILVSRPSTFEAVAKRLASGRDRTAFDAGRILFVDAEAVLSQIMMGENLDLARAEGLFKHALSQALPSDPRGAVRLYGEIVDMLCQRGLHSTAVQFEDVASALLDMKPQLSILCGYAVDRFRGDANAAELRAICQKHTHIFPVESFADVLEERTRRHEHDALDRMRAAQLRPRARRSEGTALGHTVYIVDDNASLRRSLGRLLTLSNWPVRTFDSGEAFLAELDKLSNGCLVVDVELRGMSGLELIRRLKDARLRWPIIVISGLHDEETESEASRLGALAYLRKPFDPKALLDVIARALDSR